MRHYRILNFANTQSARAEQSVLVNDSFLGSDFDVFMIQNDVLLVVLDHNSDVVYSNPPTIPNGVYFTHSKGRK